MDSNKNVLNQMVNKIDTLKRPGSIIQGDSETEKEVTIRINADWMKLRQTSSILCEKNNR